MSDPNLNHHIVTLSHYLIHHAFSLYFIVFYSVLSYYFTLSHTPLSLAHSIGHSISHLFPLLPTYNHPPLLPTHNHPPSLTTPEAYYLLESRDPAEQISSASGRWQPRVVAHHILFLFPSLHLSPSLSISPHLSPSLPISLYLSPSLSPPSLSLSPPFLPSIPGIFIICRMLLKYLFHLQLHVFVVIKHTNI